MTNVGYIDGYWGIVYFPRKRRRGYSGSSIEEMEHFSTSTCEDNRKSIGQVWNFSFHDACWSFLLASVEGSHRYDRQQLIQNLFDVLYCTQREGCGLFTPGHNYNVAAKSQYKFLVNMN